MYAHTQLLHRSCARVQWYMIPVCSRGVLSCWLLWCTIILGVRHVVGKLMGFSLNNGAGGVRQLGKPLLQSSG